ncbi:MAG: hypothetical protein Q8P41_11860 [Pseudomonadota bacterium]|nr:hypothetical protein [Pseudomonadota bacterium]
MEHVLDGALAHAASVFGLAAVTAPGAWALVTGERAGIAGLRRAGGVLLLVGAMLHLIAGAAVVEGPVVRAVTTLLSGTFYGASLGIYAGGALGTLVLPTLVLPTLAPPAPAPPAPALATPAPARWGLLAAFGAALGAAWGLARLGHAATEGTWSAAVGWTTLHVAAAVLWLGGIGMATVGGAAARARFRPVAVGCVVVLVATGGLRAVQVLEAGAGRIAAGDLLPGVAWIGALGMKGVAVAAVAVCAARTWRAMRPERAKLLEQAPVAEAGTAVEGALVAELYGVAVVILLGALLGRLPTP